MNLLFKIISICLITVFLCAILRKQHPEYAIALVVVASAIIFISLTEFFELVFESIETAKNEPISIIGIPIYNSIFLIFFFKQRFPFQRN